MLVGNARKAMSIVLSFLIFPKPFSVLYVLGGVLVFGSLLGNDIMMENAKQEKRKLSCPSELSEIEVVHPLEEAVVTTPSPRHRLPSREII